MAKIIYNIGVNKRTARLRKLMRIGQYGNTSYEKNSTTVISTNSQTEVDTSRFVTWDKFAEFFRKAIHTGSNNEESTHIRAIHPLEDSQGEPYATEKYVGEHIPEIIGTEDDTIPTDTNVFSSLRARVEFMRRSVAEQAKHLWSFLKGIHIGDFVSGSQGASIDEAGNTEVESIFVRSYMKVMELIYNRLNAVEGDTTFADSGIIESMNGNTAVIRKRWEGDFTSFQPGDIVYGYVNDTNNDEAKTYYRAWGWVRSVNRNANSLELMKYADTDVPGNKNFAMTKGMRIAKFGNNIEPTAENAALYPAVIKAKGDGYENVRQSCFYISTEQGCIIQYMGVNSPKIKRENYGTILGKIPEGAFEPEIMEKLNSNHPYMYARGILVQDLIRIGYEGVPVRTANYRGEWNEATAQSPNEYYRHTNDTYDTVTWRGAMWQCVSEHANGEAPGDSNASWARMTSAETEFQPNLLSGTRSGSWKFNAHGTDPGIAYRQELTDGRREDIFTQQGGSQQPNWHTAYFTSYCETLEAGKEYEVSFDARGVAANVSFAVTIDTGGNIKYPGSVIAQASEEWHRTSLKFTMPEGNVWALAITVSLREDGEMRMRNIMIAPKGYAKWAPSFLDLKGTDGKDGINGKDGTSVTVKSSVTTYAKTTVNTQPDEAEFTATDIGTLNLRNGEFLWSRTVVTYSDETRATTYMVSRIGTDGTDGVSGENSYLHIAYALNDYAGNLPHPTSLAGFSVVPFEGSELIGVCVDDAKADPTDFNKYSWSVYKGADGANGKDGTPGKDGINGKDGATGYGLKLVVNVTAKEEKWCGFEKTSGNDNGYLFSRGSDSFLATITSTARNDVRQGDYFQCVGKATDSGNYHKITFMAVNAPGAAMRGEYVCHETSKKGDTGVMVYPAGVYSSDTSYTATAQSPAVYYNGEYYYLKPGLTWKAGQTATPATDSANGDTANWVRMDKFNAVYSEILFANFGKLGCGVFWGDWFFSAKGNKNGVQTDDYSTFDGSLAAGTFIPCWAINLNNGEFYTSPNSADSIGIQNGILKAGSEGHQIRLTRSGLLVEGAGGKVDWSVASKDTNGLFQVKANGDNTGAISAYADGGYSRAFHAPSGTVTSNGYMGSYGMLAIEGSGINYTSSIKYGTWLLKSITSTWLQVALPTARNVARWMVPAIGETGQLPDFAVRLTIICSSESVTAVSVRPPGFASDSTAWTTRYLYPGNVMELMLVNTQSNYKIYNINGGGSYSVPT